MFARPRPAPFAVSLLTHGLILAWVASGPVREEPKSLYAQAIAPHASKLVWYNVRATQAGTFRGFAADPRTHPGMGGLRASARRTEIALRAGDRSARQQAGVVQLSREAAGCITRRGAQTRDAAARGCEDGFTGDRGCNGRSAARPAIRLAAGAQTGIAHGPAVAESAGDSCAACGAAAKAEAVCAASGRAFAHGGGADAGGSP